MDRGAWQATVHGITESRTQLSDFHLHLFFFPVTKADYACRGVVGKETYKGPVHEGH